LPAEWTGAREQSLLRARFDEYLRVGGFPEAGQLEKDRDRVSLLQSYVDSVLFRDVAERYGVSNLVALRALARQLLCNPACSLSISKLYADFHSRAVAVSKESLLALMDHLIDAFLVFTLPIATRSERRRQVNPRKLYLADHSLATAFSPAAGLNRGHLLENVVACELMRRSRDLAYVRTAAGHEVDFLSTDFAGNELLIQVVSEVVSPQTVQREIRALIEAKEEFPAAEMVLLVETVSPNAPPLPKGVRVYPVWQWLLTR
jgi:predicted AAA+ superfamily ATPase